MAQNNYLVENTEDGQETWQKLDITNDFLFNKIMENPEVCKQLLEAVLEVKIERIEYPQSQKSIRLQAEGKGVRLDVYVADEKRTVYNVEMQSQNTCELPLRSRYYQGIIDMDIISKGDGYDKLHASYVIFICTFDLFGKGLYKYTFENRCVEDNSVVLGDKTCKIFLNAKGILEDANEDIRAFLQYVDGRESDNALVQAVKNEAKVVKNNENWRSEFMMQHMRDQLKYQEGIEQGRIVGSIEMARELNVPEEVLLEQLMKKFELSKEKALEYIESKSLESKSLES